MGKGEHEGEGNQLHGLIAKFYRGEREEGEADGGVFNAIMASAMVEWGERAAVSDVGR